MTTKPKVKLKVVKSSPSPTKKKADKKIKQKAPVGHTDNNPTESGTHGAIHDTAHTYQITYSPKASYELEYEVVKSELEQLKEYVEKLKTQIKELKRTPLKIFPLVLGSIAGVIAALVGIHLGVF